MSCSYEMIALWYRMPCPYSDFYLLSFYSMGRPVPSFGYFHIWQHHLFHTQLWHLNRLLQLYSRECLGHDDCIEAPERAIFLDMICAWVWIGIGR